VKLTPSATGSQTFALQPKLHHHHWFLCVSIHLACSPCTSQHSLSLSLSLYLSPSFLPSLYRKINKVKAGDWRFEILRKVGQKGPTEE
jgi:hypothetical protein